MKSTAAWLMLASTPLLAAEDFEPAVQAVNALGITMLTQAATPGENTALSPYSIQTALAMTFAGADGVTREQMAATLHFPEKGTVEAFSTLQASIQKSADATAVPEGAEGEPVTLAVANRLFGQTGFAFRPEFLAVVKDRFAAPLDELDFHADPPAGARTINAWVEKQTRERIRNLIPDAALTRETTLVLVNALYLRAPWAVPFSENGTQPRPFHLADGKIVDAPAMTRKDTFGYARKDGYTIAALPYAGWDFQFVVFLPDTPDGLAAVEKELTPQLLADCANLGRAEVFLQLPKFKLEPPRFALGRILQKLGMPSAFDVPAGSANFDGMAPRRPNDYLYISDVFHKAFVEVNEKGTEAAAATAVTMMRTLAMPPRTPPIEVLVDRPFLFAIQHRPTGACLFLGRVMDPR